MDAKTFYGDAYNRAKNPSLLDDAYARLTKAMENETNNNGTMSKVGTMNLDLACKKEREAFAS